MPTIELSDFKGIVTAPGVEMRPDASLLSADNCVIEAPGIIRKRKGFERLATQLGGPIWKLYSSPLLGANFLAHFGTSALAASLSLGDGVGVWVAQTTVDGATLEGTESRRAQFAESSSRVYVTATGGTMRMDAAASGTLRYAGMPRGRAPDTYNMAGAAGGAYDVLTGTGGFLADGANVAYRVTWHLKDGLGVELGGPPTGRLLVRNQAGSSGYGGGIARNVALRIPVPLEFGTSATALTTSYFWRLWRSRVATTVTADDEMALVAEQFLAAGDIAAGYASFTDTTPDTFLLQSPTLHTNAVNFPLGEEGARQGVVNADDPPPQSECIASWRDLQWTANGQYRSSLLVTLLAVGGAGLVAGDTITINGTTYTARAAPALATEFKIETALASTTMNLEATTRNLCEVVNRNIADGIRLYHVSLGTQPPGTFLIHASRLAGAGTSTSALSSRGAAFRPNLTSTIAGSTNGAGNRLTFSKPYRPDAVPPINFFRIGSESEEILQLAPFRDRLMVFTTGGIYQVLGTSFADFVVQPFDTSFRLLARESVCVCDDKLYAMCHEGIIELDDGGVRVVSMPIEPSLVQHLTASTTADAAFAVPYRAKHRVHFFVPEYPDANLKGCGLWFQWDTRTRVWASGSFKTIASGDMDHRSTGTTRGSDGLLTLANWNPTSSDAWLFEERTTDASTGYQDTLSDGTTKSVLTTIATNFVRPVGVVGAMHWQQVALGWNIRRSALDSMPTALTLMWNTESALSGTVTVTPTATHLISRVETPVSVRRANRVRLTIVHDTTEHMALSAISLDVGGASRFSRRVG